VEIESKYLDEESATEGDIIEFLDEGVKEIKVSPRDKQQYVVYNFLVTNGRYSLIYTPGGDAQKLFIKQYGRETKNWKNTKFQVKFIEKIVFGQPKKVLIPQFLEVKA
jgi:hypothetical protein